MSFKEILSKTEISIVLLTLLISSVGFGIILPIVPFYSEKFGATPFQIGMLTSVFALISLILAPMMGKLGDRIGRKKLLLGGTLGFVLAYIIFAFAPNLETLFIARAIEAVAAAGIFPAAASLISDYTSEQQRGKAMALMGMSFSMGFILGPALGGIASASFGISGAFLLASSFSVVNFASVFFQLKEPKEKQESKDIPQQEISLLSHVKSPLLVIFAAGMMVSFMIGGLQSVLALYAQARLDFQAAEIGLVFTFIGVLIMVFQFASGNLISRFGEIRTIQLGLLLSAIGYGLLTFLDGWFTLLLPLTIMVAGNAFVFPSVSSLVSKKALGKRGAVMGLVSSFQSLGQFFGPLFAGFLFGINHVYAFIGPAIVVLIYFGIFSIVER
jgi:MFS transporter, DHA1 family, multidrug resistance protein